MTTETTVKEIIAKLRHHPVIQPEWLSAQATATYIGISEQTLCVYVKQGVAPKSVKFSKRARRFRRTDIDAWCAAGGPSQFQKCEKGAVVK